MTTKAQMKRVRGARLSARRVRSLTCALSAGLLLVLSGPLAAQTQPSLEDIIELNRQLMQQNQALMNQNQALMNQNQQLVDEVTTNSERIEELESRQAALMPRRKLAAAGPPPAVPGRPLAAPAQGAQAPAYGDPVPGEEETEDDEPPIPPAAVLAPRPDLGPTVADGEQDEPTVARQGSGRAVRLSLSGHINRAFIAIDDGERGQGNDNDQNVFFADNDNSSSRVRFLASADVTDDIAVGSNLEVEILSNSTRFIDQTQNGPLGSDTVNFRERLIEVWGEHDIAGKLWLGQGWTASDSTQEVDLGGMGATMYSLVSAIGNAMQFRNNDGSLSGITIGQTFNNQDGLQRADRIRYDTARFYGFSAATSWLDGGNWDAALRYNREFEGAGIRFAAAGHFADREGSDVGWQAGGSSSVLHTPTGFNFTVASALRNRGGDRDPEHYVYFKPGIRRKFVDLGETRLGVDLFHGWDYVENDSESLGAGFYAMQVIDRTATEVYAGVRWYDFDRGTGADQGLKSITHTTVGARQTF